jgi:starch phosphorylase
MRELVEEQGLSADEAVERLRASTVFTTHTPVPAGNEVFDPELVRQALGGLVERCGLAWEDFVALGKADPAATGFGLTPFALRTSQYANAVSELHGAVSREMWHGLWPERRVDEVPITSVTNGVHQRTWISAELRTLLDDTAPQFERARELSAEDLWAAHGGAKERLLEFVATTRGVRELDPEVLTIGFARRFATYKRASLLFSRPERLAKLLADPERPIQVLVAGKAHPADEGGKDVIQLVVDFAREPTAAGRVVFLEDYEMTLARRLVQGVDLWLNTPRRPFEASGTSGMKAALNGVLNCSILDGWWAEAYSPACGFAIEGRAEDGASEAEQDEADAEALYAVLEEQVLPAYYERDAAGLPQRWIELMRESIAELGPRYGTARMAAEYVERLYLPAHEGAPRVASRVG